MERDCAEVFPAALAERDGMAIDFLIAEDEHIRNFLALRVADLRVHAVRTSVDMHPQPGIAQLGGDFISGLDMAIGDRDDFGLDRGEPGGERAGVVLDQDAEEAFERAEERAMNGWFWERFSWLNRVDPNRIFDTQRCLYRAKTFVDFCVTARPAAVTFRPGSPIVRGIDHGGSLVVAAYMLISSVEVIRAVGGRFRVWTDS